MTTDNYTLPALRTLGGLADQSPTIIIDTREQTPLVFQHLESVRGTLQTGDYSIVGLDDLFAVERKTVADLVGCCVSENRERFERELHRLRGYRFKRLLIVGSELEIQNGSYMSKIRPQSVWGSLDAWQMRYDLPYVFKLTPELASLQIERWASYFSRELVQLVNGLHRASVQPR
jgi:DNA excision repair protein ERCC-4